MDNIEDILAPGEHFTADGVEYENKGVSIDGDFVTIEASEVKEG